MLPTMITLRALPDFLVRALVLLTVKLMYRIKIRGAGHIPVQGPALLVSNHVSWIDALLLSATQRRHIRFIMHRDIYHHRILNPLFRLMKVIPVSSSDSPKQFAGFLREARTALGEGSLVCIFAEGAITRNGMLQEFRPGFERIVRDSGHPIIPVYIGGAWGSMFSYARGKLLAGLPSALPYPVTILFGKPLTSDAGPHELKQAVTELSCDYFGSLKPARTSLAGLFVASARKNWKRRAASDTTGKDLSYGMTLTGAIAFSARIAGAVQDRNRVGILLPPSAGAVIANLAVTLLGKVPVNLNYTVSADIFRSSAEQCGIRHIITSRVFREKVCPFDMPAEMIFAEDVIAGLTPSAKMASWVKARFYPPRFLLDDCRSKADEPATILFSSGSTGNPKGVVLTHHNIISNVEALRMVLRITPDDNVCAALPFFHSFGFTGTLWLPLLNGFSAAYHANPLDAAKIAEVAREYRSTILLATPTFLLSYLRRADPADFASLRLVVAGAEKLKTRLADEFEAKFGIRPLEGYGATEMSPVITLSLPDVEIDGVRQIGSKNGSVGHPIPGVALKIVDTETGGSLPPGAYGLILAKGPNMMSGYLNRPDQTAEVIRDGWYVTGDIGTIDEAGFVTITDRLARFSKIAGEMVPHLALEEELHSLLNLTGQHLAVTAVPDDKKGERLVVLYTKGISDPETLWKKLRDSTLPNLWKPGRDSFLEIEALPLLGSGKLDIKGLKKIALEAFSEQGTTSPADNLQALL